MAAQVRLKLKVAATTANIKSRLDDKKSNYNKRANNYIFISEYFYFIFEQFFCIVGIIKKLFRNKKIVLKLKVHLAP